MNAPPSAGQADTAPSQAALDLGRKIVKRFMRLSNSFAEEEIGREIDRFAASQIEEWRGALADQCGQTLALQYRLSELEEKAEIEAAEAYERGVQSGIKLSEDRFATAGRVIAAALDDLDSNDEPGARTILATYLRDTPEWTGKWRGPIELR